MNIRNLTLLFVTCLLLSGCSGESTNAPTKEAVDKANVDRAAAIDNDPSLTPEGKAKMKEMMHLNQDRNKQGR